jgi:hypothetical protein
MVMPANVNVSVSDGGGGGSSLRFAYNIKGAKDLINKIVENYDNYGAYIKREWIGVVDTLQANWVGEDEQNYEKIFAKKISDCYRVSHKIVQKLLNLIAITADSLRQMQNSNVFSGQSELTSDIEAVVAPELSLPEEDIVEYRPRSFTEDMDLGLTTDKAADIIKEKIGSYVADLHGHQLSTTEAYYAEINMFMKNDELKQAYESLVVAHLEVANEIATAMKDMYNAIDDLVTKPYGNVSKNISSELNEITKDIKNVDIGNSRWQ